LEDGVTKFTFTTDGQLLIIDRNFSIDKLPKDYSKT